MGMALFLAVSGGIGSAVGWSVQAAYDTAVMAPPVTRSVSSPHPLDAPMVFQ